MRVFLYISYDGSKFFGFQQQPNKNAVMDRVIFALKELGITSKPIGSSRTDKGVHALNQTVHVDLPPFWEDLDKLHNTLNCLLHPYIHVRKISVSNLHARFDAKKRLYRYICYTGEYNPLLSDYALFLPRFDLAFINETLSLFLGRHDFGFFKKTGSETKDDIRTLYKADAYMHKNFLVFRFLGDGFLRSQVRMMTQAILSAQEEIFGLKSSKTDTNMQIDDSFFLQARIDKNTYKKPDSQTIRNSVCERIYKNGCDKDAVCEKLQAQIDKKRKTFTLPAPACGLYLGRVYY